VSLVPNILVALDATLATERDLLEVLASGGHPLPRRARLLAALSLAGERALTAPELSALLLRRGASAADVDALAALGLVARNARLVWVPATVRGRLASGESAVEVVRGAERSVGVAATGRGEGAQPKEGA
jgi:hypothetical protein